MITVSTPAFVTVSITMFNDGINASHPSRLKRCAELHFFPRYSSNLQSQMIFSREIQSNTSMLESVVVQPVEYRRSAIVFVVFLQFVVESNCIFHDHRYAYIQQQL